MLCNLEIISGTPEEAFARLWLALKEIDGRHSRRPLVNAYRGTRAMDIWKRSLLSAEADRLRKTGQSVEEILRNFRSRGLTKIESVAVLAGCSDISVTETKRIVHESSTWSDAKARDDSILEDL